jgi:hypothetical protein
MGYSEITDKNVLLSKYSADYVTLKDIIDDLNDQIIDYVPDLEGAWSIKEHIAHLVDTEVNGYLRFKKAILNPGTTIDVGGGDMEKSNKLLNYTAENLNDLMELFRLLRKSISEHAKRIKKEDFPKYYIEHVNHPTFKTCSLGFILSIHTQHFDKHLDYIKRNIELYKKSAAFADRA